MTDDTSRPSDLPELPAIPDQPSGRPDDTALPASPAPRAGNSVDAPPAARRPGQPGPDQPGIPPAPLPPLRPGPDLSPAPPPPDVPDLPPDPAVPPDLPGPDVPDPGGDPRLAGRGAWDNGAAARPEAQVPGSLADRPPLAALVEAVLMVAEKPVPVADLAAGLQATVADVRRVLRALADEYAHDGRGFALRDVGGGWRFYTAEDCAPWVEKFVLAGQMAKLSQAALETLAVVAYQQPVSRGRIAAVRGVSADGVIRTLTARGLVEEAATDPETGAILYRTTDYFLERIGLRGLDELPPLAPLLPGVEDVEEIIAQ